MCVCVSHPVLDAVSLYKCQQVDAADDMWSGGRAAGSKMLLEDVDVDDDLVPGLGPAAAGGPGAAGAGSGGPAGLLSAEDGSGAGAMDATS